MSDTDQLLAQLSVDEGFVPHLYLCPAGVLTLGRGRNLEAQPLTAREWRELYDASEITVRITEAGANRLLKNGIDQAAIQCATTFKFWDRLNHARQNVLINMTFNMGMPRLLGFKRMIAALQREDYKAAADEMLDSKWAAQVGKRAQRLADQMRSGVLP